MLAWGCPSPSQEAPLLDPRSVVTAIRKSAFPNQGWGRGFLGARPLLLLHCSVGGALLPELEQIQAPCKVLGKSNPRDEEWPPPTVGRVAFQGWARVVGRLPGA